MKIRSFLTAVLFICLNWTVISQELPLPGIFLPVTGGLGGFSLGAPSALFLSSDPRAAAWNPAGQADRELPAFSGAVRVGFPVSSSQQGGGVLFSGSTAIPTPAGTAWAILDGAVRADTLTAWAVPEGFSFHGGLSKKAGDYLSFGLGLGTGYTPGLSPEWKINASLGGMLDLPHLARGSRIMLSFLGLGWPDDPAFAPTVVAAMESRLVDSEKFSLSLSCLLASPGFTDFAAALGTSLELGRYVTVDIGYGITAKQLSNWSRGNQDASLYAPAYIPTISISFNGSSLLRLGKFGAEPRITVSPAGQEAMTAELSMVFSMGERDITGPEIRLEQDRLEYSQNLNQEITIPVHIKDESLIVSWNAVVTGPDGMPVFAAGEQLEDRSNLGQLFSVKKGLSAPEKLTIGINPLLHDGEYRVLIQARDEHGNESRYTGTAFILDGTPPGASIGLPEYRVFSPNGDGVRDFLPIQQTSSPESRWTGEFKDETGNVVYTVEWTDGEAVNFTWDGRDNTGNLVPDGIYTYTLGSADEAGNSFAVTSESITVDAASRAFQVSLTGQAMSTDPGASLRNIGLNLHTVVRKGLQTWIISLDSVEGKTFRTWEGLSSNLDTIPDMLTFDGRTRQGDPVPDGRYRFRVQLSYGNGDKPEAMSQYFIIDSQVPSVRVRSSSPVLNIDRGQRISLYHDLSEGASWKGIIYNSRGEEIKAFDLGQEREPVLQWNGITDKGEPAPEGDYYYIVQGTSPVGLTGRSNRIPLRVETGGYELSLVPEKEIFSAIAGNGRQRYFVRLNRSERAQNYSLSIYAENSQTPVRLISGRIPVPGSIDWDGRDEFGIPVPPGNYSAVFRVTYNDGETAGSLPVITEVDSTAPGGSIEPRVSLFSPNGDGLLDTADFVISSSKEGRWTGEIQNQAGETLLAYVWQGRPPSVLTWDGTDGHGGWFPDGVYTILLTGTDRAGNRFSVRSSMVTLDSRIPGLTLTADKTAFSPNGDGFADTMNFRLNPSFNDGISSWSITVEDNTGREIRGLDRGNNADITKKAVPSQTFTWDGKDDAGQKVPDGIYLVKGRIIYFKGDTVTARSSSFLMDTTPPEVKLSLTPLPFSPDGDGFEDELEIVIQAEDVSPIAGWILQINDPAGYPFTSFSGRELPQEPFYWDGINLDGDLVEAAQDYPYTLRVRDSLGNNTVMEGIISTDVFVILDGDRLKIRISSIVFPPSSSSLMGINPETDARNNMILDRITLVLNRYPEYKIRIEGHAVNLSGTDREERTELAPLSLARAESVLKALVSRGISRERLEAKGLGGTEPIVPHGDIQSRWRNRRVEFILIRP